MLVERLETDHFLSGLWKTDESSEELLSMVLNKELYLPFLQRFSKEHRRREWLATHLLLKELLKKECLIDHRPDGAPFLPDSPWHISLSHTRGYVTVLLSQKSKVGIDIECRGERILKIRNRFMHPEEEVHIDLAHETDHLLLHWCAKETLFKIMGEENVEFRQQLRIDPFPYAEHGSFTGYETRTPYRQTYLLYFRVTPEYVLTYCLKPTSD